MNSNTSMNYRKLQYDETVNPNAGNPTYGNSRYVGSLERTERVQNKAQVRAALFIPMGLDFKLCKKNSFWKHLHLFQETRFKIEYRSVPELKIHSGLGASYSFMFGWKYDIGGN